MSRSLLLGALAAAADFNTRALAINDPGSLLATLRSMGNLVPPAGRHPGSSTRVLIVAGTADPLMPRSRALNRAWPEAHFIEVPGANHDQIRAHGVTVAAIRGVIQSRP